MKFIAGVFSNILTISRIFMKEMFRVLKKDGKAHIFVPHFSNPYYYSDYTHKRHFGFIVFTILSIQKSIEKKSTVFLYRYKNQYNFQKLFFALRSGFQNKLKNSLVFLSIAISPVMEFYELHLCYIFPCDGIELVFTPSCEINFND